MTTKKPKPDATPDAPEMFDLGDGQARPTKPTNPERIHANHCFIGMECNMTDGCDGKLEHTRGTTMFGFTGIRVQFFCPKCKQFAEGHRAATGLAKLGKPVLFNRGSGKVE